MIGVSPIEIREFLSLNELNEFLEKEIAWYENLFKDYSERLGSLLREQGLSSEEIEKILREKGLTRQAASSKGKKGKQLPREGWFSFKGLLFSADKQGKAEILFELIENAEKTLTKMKEIRGLIEDLQKTGFGPGLAYSVYLVDGVPEKVFVQKAGDAARKYKLELFLSTSMEPAVALPADKEIKESSEEENEEALETGKNLEEEQNYEKAEGENTSENDLAE